MLNIGITETPITSTGAMGAIGGSINLAKQVVAGERINLSKEQNGLEKYAVGITWNEKPGVVADCDISVVLLDSVGGPVLGHVGNDPNKPRCLLYYHNQKMPGVKSYGDNLTGSDEDINTPTGESEQIDIDLGALEADVASLLILCSTHSEKNKKPGTPMFFGKVAAPVLTVYNNTNSDAPVPLYTYKLDEEYSNGTAIEIGKLYKKDNGDWMYTSLGDIVGIDAFGLESVLKKYSIV